MLKRIFSPLSPRRFNRRSNNRDEERSFSSYNNNDCVLPVLQSRHEDVSPNKRNHSLEFDYSPSMNNLNSSDELLLLTTTAAAAATTTTSSSDPTTTRAAESTSLFESNENYGTHSSDAFPNYYDTSSDQNNELFSPAYSTSSSFKSFDYKKNVHFEGDDDDDDLSYDLDEDDGKEEEAKFEFKDSMLKALRGTSSPFYTTREKVKYQDGNHFRLITQMYGSVWGKVFPFCIFNVVWCFVIDYLHDHNIVNLVIPASGHSFMSILVAFLVVARVQITYGRYMEARQYLGGCFRTFTELMQCVSVLTMKSNTIEAQRWRLEVALTCVTTLRITVAAVEYSSHNIDPYATVNVDCLPDDIAKVENFLRLRSHYQRTRSDEALRAPLVLASHLRKVLLQPRYNCSLDIDLHTVEQLKLLSYISKFSENFYGLNKLITTPFSFPLVQMSRTMLFFWVFTLPMALMTDTAERFQVAIIVFFVTYGFLGLEYVSIELDDPFGDDPNDFKALLMAQRVYEDIYLTLYQMDGPRFAEALLQKVSIKKEVYTSDKKM